jgi:hypothetical protein
MYVARVELKFNIAKRSCGEKKKRVKNPSTLGGDKRAWKKGDLRVLLPAITHKAAWRERERERER